MRDRPSSRRLPAGALNAVSRGSRQVTVVSVLALGWARLWGAYPEWDRATDLLVCRGMSRGYARGGTCVGAVFLTGSTLDDPDKRARLLRHEAVHADQWARHGLGFAVRYLVEEVRRPGARNRFEIAAGLEDGGYRRPTPPDTPPDTPPGTAREENS